MSESDTSKKGLTFERVFSDPDVNPFDQVSWVKRTAEILDSKGNHVFKQEDVEFPEFYSQLAVNIVSSKYFYGDGANGNGSPAEGKREHSLRQLVGRVASTIAYWGHADGYFDAENGKVFRDELTWLLLNQHGAFNSPVWFNVGLDVYGVKGDYDGYYYDTAEGVPKPVPEGDAYKHPQASACFLLGVEDSIPSIYERSATEGRIFKYGSGCGSNNSAIRSRYEFVSGGGRPSGPVSFMSVYDAVAKVTKSAGKTRRAAKLERLDVWHPDILEFIQIKGKEEAKAHALIREGYEANFNGEAYSTVCFQNSNMSVGFSDEFMAKITGADPDPIWQTMAVTTGTPFNTGGERMPTYDANFLFNEVASGTWRCGDPGVHFDDTINRWHTVKASGPIRTSNPCLRRGTRILTQTGWRRVEELAGPDGARKDVVFFDGVNFTPGAVWRTGTRPVVRIKLNTGETLDLTADHQVYTLDGWVAAEAALGRHVPRVFPSAPAGDARLIRCITGVSGKAYSTASPALMECLGFMQGDGTIRDGMVIVNFTPDKDGEFVDTVVMPILEDIAADRGEAGYKASPLSESRNGYVLSRTRLVEWLRANTLTSAHLPERMLPSLIWGLPQTAQAAFLRGLFGANGNILRDARNAVVLVSSCRAMLLEVQLLLRTMGIMSAVRVHNKEQEITWANGTYTSRESYHLEITHKCDIITFARLVGFPQACQQARLSEISSVAPKSLRCGSERLRATARVVEVTRLEESDDVYDFSAPATSMGLAAGLIVHNCSEFIHLDNTSCNLFALNLVRFLGQDNKFNIDRFRAAVTVAHVAQEIIVDRAGYPTVEICQNSHDFRPLGLGYVNLGALLMVCGLPYDSDEGRDFAATITAVMDAQAHLTSCEVARVKGPFAGFEKNRESYLDVMRMHCDEAQKLRGGSGLEGAAHYLWRCVVADTERYGARNAQTSLLQPGGTTSFALDASTTGIEPDIALVKYKVLAGGGNLKYVNSEVRRALVNLGYKSEPVYMIDEDPDSGMIVEDHLQAALDWIEEHGSLEDFPLASASDLAVFDCAFPVKEGGRAIRWQGHVDMMAAVQPFLSGAISKCVSGDTILTTENGLVRIGELYRGEEEDSFSRLGIHVDSGMGPEIASDFYYGGDREAYEVELSDGRRIRGTANHRLRTVVDEELGWKQTVDLEVGDFVAIKRGSEMWGDETELPRFDLTPPYLGRRTIDQPRELTRELAWLIGALTADGHVTRSNYVVGLTKNCDAVLDRTVSAFKACFGVDVHRVVDARNGVKGVTIGCKSLMEWLDAFGFSKTNVPSRILRAPRDVVLGYLSGIYLDGYVSQSVSISQKHRSIILELQTIWDNLGVSSYIGANVVNGQDYPVLHVSSHSRELAAELIEFVEPHKATAAEALRNGEDRRLFPIGRTRLQSISQEARSTQAYRSIFDPRTKTLHRSTLLKAASELGLDIEDEAAAYDYVRVRSVTPIGRTPVYDIAVPTLEQFVGNGIVNHNTINMPESSTVEDVRNAYIYAWKKGLKCVAIYRDNSKMSQPLSTKAEKSDGKVKSDVAPDPGGRAADPVGVVDVDVRPAGVPELPGAGRDDESRERTQSGGGGDSCAPCRSRLPDTRRSLTHKFSVGGHEGYVTAGLYPDGRPGELFVTMSKEGSTVRGLMDVIGTSMSIGLQYGVPLEVFVDKFSHTRFEPSGFTKNPDVPLATSVVDYIVRWLGMEFIDGYRRENSPNWSPSDEAEATVVTVEPPRAVSEVTTNEPPPVPAPKRGKVQLDAPLCDVCGSLTVRAGTCYTCVQCGSSSGCG